MLSLIYMLNCQIHYVNALVKIDLKRHNQAKIIIFILIPCYDKNVNNMSPCPSTRNVYILCCALTSLTRNKEEI